MAVKRADQLPLTVRQLINAQAAQIDRLTADVETLRGDLAAALAKIDADAGDTGGDNDYVATVAVPAALTSDGFSMDTLDV